MLPLCGRRMSPAIDPLGSPQDSPPSLPPQNLVGDPVMPPTSGPTSSVPTAAPSAKPTAAPSAHPSHPPSAVPTTVPSALPSHIPTVLPSEAPTLTRRPSSVHPTSNPTYTPPEPINFYYQVHPEVFTLQGTGYPTADYATHTGRSQWRARLVGLFGNTPNGLVDVRVKVAGRKYGYQRVALPGQPIAAIQVVVRTPLVWVDQRSVSVAYQVRDSRGHTQVSIPAPGQEVLTMRVGLNRTLGTVISCTTPDPNSGIGSCTGEISRNWFTPGGDVQVAVTVETTIPRMHTVSSPTEYVTLVQAPEYNISAVPPGLLFTLPMSTQTEGNYFTVPITVNSLGFPLDSYSITIRYDSRALSLVGVNLGYALYGNQTQDGNYSTLLVTNYGISDYGDYATDFSPLGDLTFLVLGSSSREAVYYSGALSISISSMVNVVALFVNSSYASCTDSRGMQYAAPGGCDLVVVNKAYIGILAYTMNSEIINTAAINDESLYAPIIVEGITNNTLSGSNDIITPYTVCSVNDQYSDVLSVISKYNSSAVVSTNSSSSSSGSYRRRSNRLTRVLDSNCVVEVTGRHSSGSPSTAINISYSSAYGVNSLPVYAGSGSRGSAVYLNTSVSFRVWYPELLNVRVRDSILNRIE